MKNIVNVIWLFLLAIVAHGQVDPVKMFVFGHSLIDHRPPKNPTPSDETTIAHWMYLLAEESDYTFSAGGQYGFLPTHRNLPPIAQWGYDIVPGVWDSDNEDFEDADMTTIMITAANFVQWQGPDQDYPTDPGITPISATIDIVDWIENREPSVRYYIYENWPDMAPFLNNGFPPSSAELNSYYDYLEGEFHDWWIIYHDSLMQARPDEKIKMIPVGPILEKILRSDHIPVQELFEDDAPHGRATTYFLAGLISYMSIYQEKASPNFVIPPIVHAWVRDHYQLIMDDIWKELQSFNTDSGESRVFFNNTTTTINRRNEKLAAIFPNPGSGEFVIQHFSDISRIEIFDAMGRPVKFYKTNAANEYHHISLNHKLPGVYWVRIQFKNGPEQVKCIEITR